MHKVLKISEQTFWQVLVKIVTSGSGFIILGVISRNFGEAGTGNFTLALTYLSFFYTLSDFGFNAHILGRLQVTDNRLQLEWRKLFGTRILWSLLLIILAAGLVVSLPQSFSNDFKTTVLLGGLIILFFALNTSAQAIFQAKHRYDLDIPPTLIGVSMGTLLIFLIATQNLPVYMAIFGYLLAWFIHSSGSLLLARKFTKNLTPIFDLNYLRTLIKDTWPIAGTLVLNSVYFKVDSFILSYYHSSSVVGVYNIAFQIFQTLLVLPVFIMNAFYPLMLQTLKAEANKFKSQIKLAAAVLLIASFVVGLTTYLLAPFGVSLVTGSGFLGSVESLRILSFGFPAFFLSALLMWVMIAKNMYKLLFLIYALGLVFNLIANLIFIPEHSIFAASVITGISEYLILALQVMVLWRPWARS